ncbi:MAG: cysteine methyltransferase [Burkholderiales bacterium RIFCSPHIGHO2_12_FULL_67_38]|nr:MAG: cysteine methyltransferase [Burkholderiales bacterium RIFCSPLOWO2_02_FULL_67_64]OGB37541.1 MAG: cysteine methyltransferase [Burkholderiales bacterium RIFCSPHIGHO2_12_FULL_67_38]
MSFLSQAVQTTIPSPLGPLLLAASPRGLAGVWYADQRHLPLPQQVQRWPIDHDHALLQTAAAQLGAYFQGERLDFDLPLDLSGGTPFQRAVWLALLGIPAGHTRSYGDMARQIDRPAAVRAVGAAIGRNPLGIVVPCHRVVGGNGSLTGYAGGLDRKRALLRLEGALIDKAHQWPEQTSSTGRPAAQPLPAH